MKKTLKLILAAMLALLVFVSCENKTDVSNKTALDYLAGKSIATSLELNLDDIELDEDELDYIISMYLPLPIAFDANGTITTKYVDILDFKADVDGMVYKTSFKQEYWDYDPELGMEVASYCEYKIDFKVLNENKATISGTMTYDGDTIRFKETEASIFGNLPSWFTSSDWVYIPNEELEESTSTYFTIFNDEYHFDSMEFGYYSPYSQDVVFSSKNDVVSLATKDTAKNPEAEFEITNNLEFAKISENEAKLNIRRSESEKNTENNIVHGEIKAWETTVKRVDRVPEWADGIYDIVNSEEGLWIPISNIAIEESFYGILDFDRVVDEDSIKMTIIYLDEIYDEELYEYFDVLYKKEITINKPASDDEFSCTYECFIIDEDGNEVLDWSVVDTIFREPVYI